VKPLDPNAALIVVDMQKGFGDSSWGARNNPTAESCIESLLYRWRAASAPVIHVHHCSKSPVGCFRPGTPGIEPIVQVAPRNGEIVYRKSVNSAFIGTTLEADLRQHRISSLVVVGLTSNHCVSTTVRMAGNLGFTTYVVSDATAAFDRAGANGRPRSAEEVHNAALGDLRDEFAEVVDTETVIAAVMHLRGALRNRNLRAAYEHLMERPR
jgi:nicotinamidase-related amidase